MALFFTLLLICSALHAQRVTGATIDSRLQGTVYQEETAVELKANTAGLSLAYYKGNLKTYYATSFKKIEIGYIRHPKEYRQSVNRGGSGLSVIIPGSSYVYGKQHSLLYVKASIGRKRYLSEKTRRKGIAVGYSYEVGPTLGILKPYYLQVSVENDLGTSADIVSIRYREDNEDIFLDRTAIRAHSGFFEGIDEPSFVLGVHARGSIHLAPGAYNKFVKAMDIGVQIDAFSKRVPIMVIDQNKYVFINLFVSVHLGKRS